MTEDQWQHWRNALVGNVGPIHENEPQSGFYRVKNDPVAIWRDGDDLFAERAGRPVADVCALWTYAAKWPISCELYEAVAERGEPWPDAIEEPAGIGHNAEDEHAAITAYEAHRPRPPVVLTREEWSAFAILLDQQAARIAALEAEVKVWREAHDVQKKHHWRAAERVKELQAALRGIADEDTTKHEAHAIAIRALTPPENKP